MTANNDPPMSVKVIGSLIILGVMIIIYTKLGGPLPILDTMDKNEARAAPAAPAAVSCWLRDDAPCDPALRQDDQRWRSVRYGDGPMSSTGCAPTAMAMILTSFSGKLITPAEVAKFALSKDQYENGHGSKHTIAPVVADNWHVKAVKIDGEAAIKQAVSSGALVIISGGGPAPFTKDGHYIVIRAVNPDGSVTIANPAGGLQWTNNRTWNLAKEILIPPNPKTGTGYRPTSVYAISR